MYKRFVKRGLDLVIALGAMILCMPVYLVIALLVRLFLGSPVLFTQERPGLHGRIFKLYKFRSMSDARDAAGNLLPDEKRLTAFGKLMRKTSLDELPELFNILKGDMSLVGPRPLLVKYLPYYTAKEMHRHDVRPGLTGLAQVHGRNSLNWEDRFRYDLIYVKRCSLALDLQILKMTIESVLHADGIQSGTEQTIPDFDDYRKAQQKEDA